MLAFIYLLGLKHPSFGVSLVVLIQPLIMLIFVGTQIKMTNVVYINNHLLDDVWGNSSLLSMF